MLNDGAVPTERVAIERVCAANTYREGYTDSKGYFSLQIGANNGMFADASVNSPVTFGGGSTFGPPSSLGGNQQSTTMSGVNTQLWGCELRAVLPGYHSDSVDIGNRRQLDNPDVGTIILTRMLKVDGYTTSAAIAGAPKDSKKAYEKGLNFVKKIKPDEAQEEFLKAVQIYPKHAAAWFELGKLYEQRNHMDEARDAYHKANEADSNYVNPYERLYIIALREGKWQDAADISEKVLHLNPYEFSGAYYANAIANTQLLKWDAAEKSAKEATKLRGTQLIPKSFFVLGVIEANKGNFTEATTDFNTFLKSDPSAADRDHTQKMLAEIDKQVAAQAKPAGAAQ
jgi:tetratricopeptide (TPR) repeat protein